MDILQTLCAAISIGLDVAARCADSISPPELASVGRPADNTTLLQRIEELSRQVETLSAERDRRRSSPRDLRYNQRDRPSSTRNLGLNNNTPSRLDNATLLLVPSALRRSGAKLYPALQLQRARETDAADVSGGTRLHYCHRPPFRHRQVQ
jgi:hypothetical protein